MSEQINIEVTEEAKRVIRDLQTLPDWAMKAVAMGMDKANQFALAVIQKDHLTGRGPFPPEEHRLGVVTNRLRSGAWASPAVVNGQEVMSAIGDNVIYAAIHEFGGKIHVGAKKGKVRLRTNAQGELMRQNANAHLAVFAKAGHKRVKEVDYESEEHDIEMPERAPFRTGIEESSEIYGRVVSEELVGAWEERGK
jgi:phage gpG-like protein